MNKVDPVVSIIVVCSIDSVGDTAIIKTKIFFIIETNLQKYLIIDK